VSEQHSPFRAPEEFRMSAVNPLPDTALQPAPEACDDVEPATQPWHPPPVRDSLSALEGEDFDFHDTIPAPPWLDEP
jgi:hypothetical protein